MRYRNSKVNKKGIIILIVIGLLLLAIAIGILVFTLISNSIKVKEGKEIERISIAHTSNIEYYIGEQFNPEGVSIQVVTKDLDNVYFVDYKELTFSGFDSSVPNEDLKITVSYKGFTTSFSVKILEIPSLNPTLKEISVGGLKTTYTLEKWNRLRLNLEGATLKCVYTDDSVKEIPLIPSHIYGANKVDAPGEYEITVKYSEGAIQKEISVKITITE